MKYSLFKTLHRIYLSLYARIVLIYLLSMVMLSVATALIAVNQFDQLGREWLQRSQLEMAQHLAAIMQQPLEQGIDSAEAQTMAQRIMVINPSITLYALDNEGHIVKAFGGNQCALGKRIDPHAIESLLSSMPMLPVYSRIPCSSEQGVFSVAPIAMGPQLAHGYLYVQLEGSSSLSMATMWKTSSISRTLLMSSAVALALTLVLGLFLFALLTRRFARVAHAVQEFSRGNYHHRVMAGRDDEIGRVGKALNDMAATIETQMAALRENDRQRQALVANLSHEFRTPLTSLQGYTQQLSRSNAPGSQVDTLNAIQSNIQRLTRLASQLSQMSKSNISDRPLYLENYPLAELVNDVFSKLHPLANERDVALEIHNQAGMTQVSMDLELIDHTLTNLIENALLATDQGGQVSVYLLLREDKKITVEVQDTGIGIKSGELALVTQRFYRASNNRQRSPGTGLGLSIVADALHRHGTHLSLKSQPGKGTCASFSLPVTNLAAHSTLS